MSEQATGCAARAAPAAPVTAYRDLVRLDARQARERFAAARVARLATMRPEGGPHLVPVVFALDGETLYTAVDQKPKSTTALRRLANIASDSRVCLLADHYDDDWATLWWARADGRAGVLPPGDPGTPGATELLAARYPQYRREPPRGALIVVRVERWTGWAAHGEFNPWRG